MSATPESDYQNFATRVGATFTVDVEPKGTVDLELVECSPAVASDGWFSYSLSFRGSDATPLGQGTFIFNVDGLEPTAIFIVPVSSSPLGIVYEAHFTVQEG